MGKRIQTFNLKNLATKVINLGYVGENEHTQIVIDCSEVLWDYPDAVASMVVQPPRGPLYPVMVTRDENNVVWEITASDVVYAGSGQIQLTFTNNGEIVKSAIGATRISGSIETTGEAPEPLQNWMDQAEETAARIADEAAECAAEDVLGSMAPVYSAEETYAVGDYVFHDGSLYRCTTAITTAEEWNASHWEEATLTESVSDDVNGLKSEISGKVDEPSSDGTDGQVLATDGSGGRYWKTVSGGGGGTSDYTDLTNKPQINGVTLTGNKSLADIGAVSYTEEELLRDEIPGTSTTVTMDSNGNPTSIVHTANSETVRTDSFVWGTGTVTETRTLANGKYITITTNLVTLAQTISDIQEVA